MHSIPSIDNKSQLLLYCAQVLLEAIKKPPGRVNHGASIK